MTPREREAWRYMPLFSKFFGLTPHEQEQLTVGQWDYYRLTADAWNKKES